MSQPPFTPGQPEPVEEPTRKRRRWPWVVALAVVAPFSFAVGMVFGEDVGYQAATDDIKAEAADTRPGAAAAADEPTSEPPAEEPAVEEPPAEPAEEPEPPEYGNFTDNNVFVWEDGLEVTVSDLQEFTPNEYAIDSEAPAYVRLTVTISNNTGAEFDPSMFYATMQSGGREGDGVYDEGLDGGPMATTLLDGRDITFDLGYGVDDPADLVLEVEPSFEHDTAIFTTDAQ